MLNGIIRSGGAKVYLATGATDMRKSIDGLSAIVSYSFALDPFDQSLFVFCNRERNKLKILYWDHNGFWLFYRRLERGRFAWPKAPPGEVGGGEVGQCEPLLVGAANYSGCSTVSNSNSAVPTPA